MPMMRWACLCAVLARLVLDALDDVRRLEARLALHAADQLVLGLLAGEAGDLLELGALLGGEAGELGGLLLGGFLAGLDLLLPARDLALLLDHLIQPLVERVLLLGEPPLDRLELLAPGARRLLELAARLQQLLLGRQIGLAPLGLGLARRVLEPLLRFAPGLGQQARGAAAREIEGQTAYRDRHGHQRRDQNQIRLHVVTP